MRVTSITPQKKDPTRVSVSIDDSFWIGMAANTLAKIGIQVGTALTPERKEYIEHEVVFDEGLSRALHYLSYRMRSEEEIRTKLADYEPELTERIIEQLRGYGYVDDAQLAAEIVEGAKASRRGPQWAYTKAYKLGVSKQMMKTALDDYSEEDQIAIATQYCQENNLLLPKDKLWRRLAGRGFNFDIVGIIVEEFSIKADETD